MLKPNPDARYGRSELKARTNGYLLVGLGISIALHVVAVVLLWMIVAPDTEANRKDIELQLAALDKPHIDTLRIQLINFTLGEGDGRPGGGGGGAPDVKLPVAKAQKGDPFAHGASSVKGVRDAGGDADAGKKPVPTTKDKPQTSTGTSRGKKDSTNASSTDGLKGQNTEGTGDKPAGGSGGPGIGHGAGSGVGDYSTTGFGRGWLVRPSAKYPDGSSATGTVVLRFTVEPDGTIGAIIPIKRADQALVNAATRGLKRARARPLPADVPQVNQQATISYNFELH